MKISIKKQSDRGSVVIIGFGWVGQANALAAASLGFKVGYFDIGDPKLHFSDGHAKMYRTLTRLSHPTEWDSRSTIYLVCVGDKVSEEGLQDISAIKKALKSLSSVNGQVVLRSTVISSHIRKLSFDFYLPEFLHEKYAVKECLNSRYFVLGINKSPKQLPELLEVLKQRSEKVFIGSPIEASYIKYLSNIWNALRIAFVNEFGHGMIRKGNLSEDEVHQIFSFFFENKPYLKYGKEFDGHCLPKDTRALSREHFPDNDILNALYLSNEKHGKRVKNKNVKKWFSSW
jgi:UDP-glucose 6-dehydrogenase